MDFRNNMSLSAERRTGDFRKNMSLRRRLRGEVFLLLRPAFLVLSVAFSLLLAAGLGEGALGSAVSARRFLEGAFAGGRPSRPSLQRQQSFASAQPMCVSLQIPCQRSAAFLLFPKSPAAKFGGSSGKASGPLKKHVVWLAPQSRPLFSQGSGVRGGADGGPAGEASIPKALAELIASLAAKKDPRSRCFKRGLDLSRGNSRPAIPPTPLPRAFSFLFFFLPTQTAESLGAGNERRTSCPRFVHSSKQSACEQGLERGSCLRGALAGIE